MSDSTKLSAEDIKLGINDFSSASADMSSAIINKMFSDFKAVAMSPKSWILGAIAGVGVALCALLIANTTLPMALLVAPMACVALVLGVSCLNVSYHGALNKFVSYKNAPQPGS